LRVDHTDPHTARSPRQESHQPESHHRMPPGVTRFTCCGRCPKLQAAPEPQKAHPPILAMDRQTYELSLLCILACACIALAWALGNPLFVGIFTAEALWAFFMAVYLSRPPD
jgi:hypothetical protein